MTDRFLKLNIDNDYNHPGDWLAANHPNAFILLYFIARRARRVSGLMDGLEIGMAKIGDWEKIGLSRQNYRTALKVLTSYKFLEIIENNRNRKKSTTGLTTTGTIVKLLDTRIWDINSETPNHRSNHCLTTAQPLPNHEEERIRKKKNEERKEDYARTASQPRTKDAIFFNFQNWQFEGIGEKDIADWKIIYPHIDLAIEMKKAAQWLQNNPSKSNKKLWRKYLTGWFSRANDSIENKKAFRTAAGNTAQDRRTRDVHGNPVDSPHAGRF